MDLSSNAPIAERRRDSELLCRHFNPSDPSDRKSLNSSHSLPFVQIALLLAIVASCPSYADDIPTPTMTSICDIPSERGTDEYNKYCTSIASPVPSGPSPEELQKQRDEQDIKDASDDAWDHGVTAYKRGDYAAAVKYFSEALSYTPDEPNLKINLARAQQKLNEKNAALQQARIAQQHSSDAVNTYNLDEKSADAQVGFDRAGAPAANADAGSVFAGANTKYDPVVPESKRTPQITELEKQRAAARTKLETLDSQLKAADPKADPVKISKLKQSETTTEHKIQYLNLSISAELDKPATPAKSHALAKTPPSR